MLWNYNIYIFGFPAKVLVWMLIAFFLGLIFSMFQYPEFWRKVFHGQHQRELKARQMTPQEKAEKHALAWKKTTKILIVVIGVILLLIGIFYLVGVLNGNSA